MTLTLTQAVHRAQSLSGELKAAHSALTDCEADAAAKQRIASIAVEAVDNAKANIARLEQERAELAEHTAALILKSGEAIEQDDSARNADGTPYYAGATGQGAHFADFGHPAQNCLDTTAIDEAYDRAVNP